MAALREDSVTSRSPSGASMMRGRCSSRSRSPPDFVEFLTLPAYEML